MALVASAIPRQRCRVDEQPRANYSRLRERGGCRRACLLHLFMIAAMFVLAVIWIIRNRAWELVITIEWPY